MDSQSFVDFQNLRGRFPAILQNVEGWLTDREIEFLAAAAAFQLPMAKFWNWVLFTENQRLCWHSPHS